MSVAAFQAMETLDAEVAFALLFLGFFGGHGELGLKVFDHLLGLVHLLVDLLLLRLGLLLRNRLLLLFLLLFVVGPFLAAEFSDLIDRKTLFDLFRGSTDSFPLLWLFLIVFEVQMVSKQLWETC